MNKIPVTVLTGFLGSGKTTLLNRILTESHGQRIAVIENEFGEIGIDQALVVNADEEVFEMNNGCIWCTVRGDLVRILGNLMKRRDRFDRILVETTGMADPGPVAQTFFVDDETRDSFALDGIVALVDSKHVSLHIEDSSECKEQIAFADVLVLNKTFDAGRGPRPVDARAGAAARRRRLDRSHGLRAGASRVVRARGAVHQVIAWSGRAAYTATKGGVEMMMKTMAQEAGPYGVRVLAIAPGAVGSTRRCSTIRRGRPTSCRRSASSGSASPRMWRRWRCSSPPIARATSPAPPCSSTAA